MKKITNAVTYVTGYSDSPLVADFYYTSASGKYRGAELLLSYTSKFPLLTEYLRSGTPYNPASNIIFSVAKHPAKSAIQFPREQFLRGDKVLINDVVANLSSSEIQRASKSRGKIRDELPF